MPAGGAIVTAAEVDLVVSATLDAVIVTLAGDGATAGAAYSPLEEIVPQAATLQPVPDALHVTAVFDVPVTEAVNCCVAPVVMDTAVGVTATATPCAVPVPLRLTDAVLFVEDVLAMVSCPVAGPTAVGSNSIFRITCWPGLNVDGSAAPGRVKPVPVIVSPLIVTGRMPIEVNITGCVADVFTTTSPKATLVALMLSARIAAFNWMAKFLTTPPALAVIVTA